MDFFPITQQNNSALPAVANEPRAIETIQAATPGSTSSSSQAEDFDTFLTLLTAQIRNQDPLEPVDSTQFVEQLATFSNLELQAKGNQILEGIAQLLERNLAPSAPVSAPNPENLI